MEPEMMGAGSGDAGRLDDERLDWLLAQPEGQYLEFKQAVSDSLGRAVCAFANGGGGAIIVGVGPDGTLAGISDASGEAARAQSMARMCDPPVDISVKHFSRAGRRLLAIEVPDSRQEAHSYGSTFYMRVGATTQSMGRDEVIDFLYSAGQVRYEEKLCRDFRYPADFDRKTFLRFIRKAGISRPGNIANLLVNLRLARRESNRVLLNNAGVLFFAKAPKRFLSHGYIDCILFQGTEKLSILDRQELDGDLLDNVERTMVFLERNLRLRYEIEGLYRKEILEIPPEALREAVLNAVVHRDYHFDSAWITVKIFWDRVEISSPGGLPPGLEAEELGTKSVHRNRLLAEMFHRLGEVERAGSGIKNMRGAVKDAGLPPPRFEFTTFFTVVFRRPKGQPGPGSTPQVTPQVAPQVTPQVRALLELCSTPRTGEEILAALGLSDRKHLRKTFIKPAIAAGRLAMTIPEKPNSSRQQYLTTDAGKEILNRNQTGSARMQ
jgi:ATP-dependent DNA helicase RecG